MESEVQIELGWGFYLIILPLIATILMEILVKPMAERLRDRLQKNSFELTKMREWLRKKF